MSKDKNGVERRGFRQHWLVGLALPGFPWLALIALIFFAVLFFLPYSRSAPGLFVFTVFPLLKLFQLYTAWLGYSISVTAGSNVLRERSGVFSVTERLIPLTQFGTVEKKQPWWASVLHIDVGNIKVGAMGGPYILRSIGDFSDLWQVLQSRGETVPYRRPSALAVLTGLLWHAALVLSHSIFTRLSFRVSRLNSWGSSVASQVTKGLGDWVSSLSYRLGQPARQPAPVRVFGFTVDTLPGPSRASTACSDPSSACRGFSNGGYVYEGKPFSPLTSSSPGFCAFCEQFVLTDRNWTGGHYCARNLSRAYYPSGIAEHIACSYLDSLRQAFILIPGPNGSSEERLSCRIRSIEDIKCLASDFAEPLSEVA